MNAAKSAAPKTENAAVPDDEDNVVNFTGVTRLSTSPERVLKDAIKSNLREVIVLGYTATGEEYFASSEPDGPSALWHLERAKFNLMGTFIEDEED